MYLIPEAAAPIQEMKRALQEYYDDIRGKRQHGRGPPAVHAVAALLDALAEASPTDEPLKKIHSWTTDPARTWQEVTALIPHCRWQPIGPYTTSDGTVLRMASLQLAFSPVHQVTISGTTGYQLTQQLHQVVTENLLTIEHASVQPGQPPPKKLEKILQRMMD
jgi:hypothetical protein